MKTFYEKLLKNYETGKATVIKGRNNEYSIFTTLNDKGCIRKYDWGISIDKVIEIINLYFCSEEEINECSENENWKIVKTIDAVEFFGQDGFKKGDKVRILPNAKEECKKSDLSWSEVKQKMVDSGFGYFYERNGDAYLIKDEKGENWLFPRQCVEYYFEEDDDDKEYDDNNGEKWLLKKLEIYGWKIKDNCLIK